MTKAVQESRKEAALEALERLIKMAKGDTGQCGRVARFLLSWWNASEQGGFDQTDLWGLDREIVSDVARVFGFIATTQIYPDKLGYADDFAQIIERWGRTT